MSAPDYSDADRAETNDGRVISWSLVDVAFELRTANLIALLQTIPPTPSGKVANEALSRKIAERLGLTEKGWDES